MREIVLDTETTGLDPAQGHRLVEVGCIELLNRIPTGATFHAYLNPEREVPAEAFAIHGLSYDFLKGHKRFSEICDEFMAFIVLPDGQTVGEFMRPQIHQAYLNRAMPKLLPGPSN